MKLRLQKFYIFNNEELYHYFKWSTSNFPLPSANGPLSREVPAIAISKANKDIARVLKDSEDEDGVKRQGTYQKYTPKDKATIRNYAVMHGMSTALHHFKNKFPDLKYGNVCEWRKAIIVAAWKDLEVLTELEGKKRGKPAMLPENLTSLIMKYIHATQARCWWHNQHSQCDSCSFRRHKEGKSWIVGM